MNMYQSGHKFMAVLDSSQTFGRTTCKQPVLLESLWWSSSYQIYKFIEEVYFSKRIRAILSGNMCLM